MDNSICVVGMGYIGLPTALLFAAAGKKVYGVDVIKEKIETLKKGKLPFEEPGLENLFSSVKKQKKLFPSDTIVPADCYIIAVPTPQANHKADLTFVMQALKNLLPYIQRRTLVVLESTIGPSDCEKYIIPFLETNGKHNVSLAHCPERAIPGNTVYEMQHNARIVGGRTPEVAERVKKLYDSFVKGKIHMTNLKTAAACKVMENTYRDVNIALANEFAKIADDIRFDVWEAIGLANLHPRVQIHQPGPGVGGHCIAIDPWYFVGESKQAVLISKARSVNDGMPAYVSRQINQVVKKINLQNPIIGVLGYAYKKNVDDARETPIESLLCLLEKKNTCLVHDPHVHFRVRKSTDLETLLQKAQIVVLATDHDVYTTIKFQNYPNIQAVYDTRNVIKNSQIGETYPILYRLGDGQLP